MKDTFRLRIDGMHCAACVRRVTAALSQAPGVHVQSVEIGSAVIRLEPAAKPESATQAVDAIGFRAAVVPEV